MSQLVEPQANSASEGIRWFGQAFQLFRLNPGSWIGACLLYLLISMLISLVPIAGSMAMILLDPVFLGGLMIGCQAQAQGQPFKVDYLFKGFSTHTRALLKLGMIYFVLTFLCTLPAILLGMGSILMQGGSDANINLPVLALGVLVSLCLLIPLLMSYWLAPALIIDRNLPAIDALKLSLRGCLKNIGPLTLYSLIVLFWLILGAIPFLLGWLVVFPCIVGSTFVAYQNIFKTENNSV